MRIVISGECFVSEALNPRYIKTERDIFIADDHSYFLTGSPDCPYPRYFKECGHICEYGYGSNADNKFYCCRCGGFSDRECRVCSIRASLHLPLNVGG